MWKLACNASKIRKHRKTLMVYEGDWPKGHLCPCDFYLHNGWVRDVPIFILYCIFSVIVQLNKELCL